MGLGTLMTEKYIKETICRIKGHVAKYLSPNYEAHEAWECECTCHDKHMIDDYHGSFHPTRVCMRCEKTYCAICDPQDLSKGAYEGCY